MYMLLKDVEHVKVNDIPSVVLIDGLRLRVQVGQGKMNTLYLEEWLLLVAALH